MKEDPDLIQHGLWDPLSKALTRIEAQNRRAGRGEAGLSAAFEELRFHIANGNVRAMSRSRAIRSAEFEKLHYADLSDEADDRFEPDEGEPIDAVVVATEDLNKIWPVVTWYEEEEWPLSSVLSWVMHRDPLAELHPGDWTRANLPIKRQDFDPCRTVLEKIREGTLAPKRKARTGSVGARLLRDLEPYRFDVFERSSVLKVWPSSRLRDLMLKCNRKVRVLEADAEAVGRCFGLTKDEVQRLSFSIRGKQPPGRYPKVHPGCCELCQELSRIVAARLKTRISKRN